MALTVEVIVAVGVKLGVAVPVGCWTCTEYPDTGKPVKDAGWPPLLELVPVKLLRENW